MERLFADDSVVVDTIVVESFSKLGTRYVPYHIKVDQSLRVVKYGFGPWDEHDVDAWGC